MTIIKQKTLQNNLPQFSQTKLQTLALHLINGLNKIKQIDSFDTNLTIIRKLWIEIT